MKPSVLISILSIGNEASIMQILEQASCADAHLAKALLLYHAVLVAPIETIFLLLELGADPFVQLPGTQDTAFERAILLQRDNVTSLFACLRQSSLVH